MSAIADITSTLANVASICDDEVNRHHNRLALIGIAVAMLLAAVGIGLELWMINHAISSLTDGLTSHLMPTTPQHVASTR